MWSSGPQPFNAPIVRVRLCGDLRRPGVKGPLGEKPKPHNILETAVMLILILAEIVMYFHDCQTCLTKGKIHGCRSNGQDIYACKSNDPP